MEVPHGNSLCSYLKQPKMSFFFFSSYKKSEKGIRGPAWGWRVGTNGSREEVGKW
jgi:hypothetical protein